MGVSRGAVTFGGAVGQHQAIVAALGDALPRPADEPDAASEPSARSAHDPVGRQASAFRPGRMSTEHRDVHTQRRPPAQHANRCACAGRRRSS